VLAQVDMQRGEAEFERSGEQAEAENKRADQKTAAEVKAMRAKSNG
jgi:uncharacterized membrane protein YqiK